MPRYRSAQAELGSVFPALALCSDTVSSAKERQNRVVMGFASELVCKGAGFEEEEEEEQEEEDLDETEIDSRP